MGKAAILFGRCRRSATKALCWVRDTYVRSLMELCGSLQYVTATGYGSFAPSYGFPMEITRSWNTREIFQPCEEPPGDWRAKVRTAPFSHRVVLETIDEDKPCEFGADVRVCSGLLPGRVGVVMLRDGRVFNVK